MSSSSLMPAVVDNAPVQKKSPHDPAAGAAPSSSHGDDPASAEQQQQMQLDFIGSANAVKDLFALPYALDRPVSVAVHNCGGTLILDSDPGQLEPPAAAVARKKRSSSSSRTSKKKTAAALVTSTEEKDPSDDDEDNMTRSLVALSSLEDSVSSSEALTLVNTLIQQHNTKLQQQSSPQSNTPDGYAAHFIPPTPEPREFLSWKFRDMNLLVGSDALIYRAATNNSTAALAVRVEDACRMQALLQQHEETVTAGAFVPDHRHTPWQQRGKLSYAEAAAAKKTQTKLFIQPDDKKDEEDEKEEQNNNGKSEEEAVAATNSKNNKSFAAPNLDQVQLQTCIVPYANEPCSLLSAAAASTVAHQQHNENSNSNSRSNPIVSSSAPSSPVSTVLDTYLDNIMANVPQLALCLQEKGFIQSVKLLNTEAIPSQFMQRETFDTSVPLEFMNTNANNSAAEDIFSPQVMEMNASALLRFLKTNCSRDNATYLFRREAGVGNNSIQLFDISSISAQRQQKWIWWLAMISYRFAQRLRHLSSNSNNTNIPDDPALRRNFRVRQRSLLQNCIDLLESLADMTGNAHESLTAAVREHLADTFLVSSGTTGADDPLDESTNADAAATASTSNKPTAGLQTTPAAAPVLPPVPAVALHQPYAHASADALGKAQDYLVQGIKILNVVLVEHSQEQTKQQKKKKQRNSTVDGTEDVKTKGISNILNTSVETCESDSDDENEKDDNETASTSSSSSSLASQDDMDPVVTQLFGMHHKLIDVSLRLAEIHLKNYYSSSAMHNLRTAAQNIARSLFLMQLVDHSSQEPDIVIDSAWRAQLQLQSTWLWEQCGYFARSFAADGLWRDRGHASGDDVVSVLLDVEAAFTELVSTKDDDSDNHKFNSLLLDSFCVSPPSTMTNRSAAAAAAAEKSQSEDISGGTVLSFQCLSGIIVPDSKLISATQKAGADLAKQRLLEQKMLQRDKRKVLVAASVAYSRATKIFGLYLQSREGETTSSAFDQSLVELLQQRLGDACNETGKVMLNELRSWLVSLPSLTNVEDETVVSGADIMCSSAEFWFLEGLHSFEACRDLRNLALMRCNLCQIYKIRANAIFAKCGVSSGGAPTNKKGVDVVGHADRCLRGATNHLQKAHDALGVRDFDPNTWDMVSTELAATFLVLGVRRRQALLGSAASGNNLLLQAMRLSPGSERSIVDPMTRALGIYEQMGNQHQAGATHYQLAQFYSKIWTCQRDEVKTREKLGAAFQHYNAAFALFSQAVRGNEATFCLLCLDVASLYSTVSGQECLEKALVRCLDTAECFGSESILAVSSDLAKRGEWFQKMDTLAASVEDRVFKLLKSLVKLEEDGGSGTTQFKDLYRTGLTTKIVSGKATFSTTLGDEGLDAIANRLTAIFQILKAIWDQYYQSNATHSDQK